MNAPPLCVRVGKTPIVIDKWIYHALATRPRAPRPDPPFPLVSSASFGSARSRPGREAAKRTLDGEDRFGILASKGKGGLRGG